MSKKLFEELLGKAGITINGSNPWDLQIKNEKTYKRIAANYSLGAGESYMEGWWECEALDEFFYRLLTHIDADGLYGKFKILFFFLKSKLLNIQSITRSTKVAKVHYNLGNELYSHMLGESMGYTCGYYRDTDDLDQAQFAKFDLICRKLQLQPGERLLDLGCGWGTFSKYAAENYGVEVVAVNISHEQVTYARNICAGLPITFAQCDYRDTKTFNPEKKPFDKIASIGMCEHIGHKNYKHLLNIARDNLKPDGLFLLHSIMRNNSLKYVDPWIEHYIFPNAVLPSVASISSAAENIFILEDCHNFGPDYDKTLMAWCANFTKAWPQLKDQYDERFYRMWRYYLLSCAGAFRARDMQLWQFVMSPAGTHGTYPSIR